MEREEETCYLRNNDNVSPLVTLRESEPWIVGLTTTVKVPPSVKKMVVVKIKFLRLQETPNLVCIKSAQMPYKGVLAARGISPVLQDGDRSREIGSMTRRARLSQLKAADRAEYVHFILVNFTEVEKVIPKVTVLGVSEVISPTLVAAINDGASAVVNEVTARAVM